MIDLRSDTLTLPDMDMLQTIMTAKLGDDGRVNDLGRGEDETVNLLEDKAAAITGKEAALFCNSGTMGNTTALLTYCAPGANVLVDDLQHLYRSEKVAFESRLGQLNPVFYHYDRSMQPDAKEIEDKLQHDHISLLCLENTHNFHGGTCTTLERLQQIHELAQKFNVPVHMDGARLFNAAAYLQAPAAQICQHVESVMFCFSKGLAAPVGSVLCGSREFIKKARDVRKLLGGNMRQSGVIAAPALYALSHNIERLKEDNENAQYCASLLSTLSRTKLQEKVETNILMLDVSALGISNEEYCQKAKQAGLFIRPVLPGKVRLVFYKGITREDAGKAAQIIQELDNTI